MATYYDASWQKLSAGQGMKQSVGVGRSKVRITQGIIAHINPFSKYLKNYAANFNQTLQAHITLRAHCVTVWMQKVEG